MKFLRGPHVFLMAEYNFRWPSLGNCSFFCGAQECMNRDEKFFLNQLNRFFWYSWIFNSFENRTEKTLPTRTVLLTWVYRSFRQLISHTWKDSAWLNWAQCQARYQLPKHEHHFRSRQNSELIQVLTT